MRITLPRPTGESGTYKYVDAYTFFNFVKNHAPVTEIQ